MTDKQAHGWGEFIGSLSFIFVPGHNAKTKSSYITDALMRRGKAGAKVLEAIGSKESVGKTVDQVLRKTPGNKEASFGPYGDTKITSELQGEMADVLAGLITRQSDMEEVLNHSVGGEISIRLGLTGVRKMTLSGQFADMVAAKAKGRIGKHFMSFQDSEVQQRVDREGGKIENIEGINMKGFEFLEGQSTLMFRNTAHDALVMSHLQGRSVKDVKMTPKVAKFMKENGLKNLKDAIKFAEHKTADYSKKAEDAEKRGDTDAQTKYENLARSAKEVSDSLYQLGESLFKAEADFALAAETSNVDLTNAKKQYEADIAKAEEALVRALHEVAGLENADFASASVAVGRSYIQMANEVVAKAMVHSLIAGNGDAVSKIEGLQGRINEISESQKTARKAIEKADQARQRMTEKKPGAAKEFSYSSIKFPFQSLHFCILFCRPLFTPYLLKFVCFFLNLNEPLMRFSYSLFISCLKLICSNPSLEAEHFIGCASLYFSLSDSRQFCLAFAIDAQNLLIETSLNGSSTFWGQLTFCGRLIISSSFSIGRFTPWFSHFTNDPF